MKKLIMSASTVNLSIFSTPVRTPLCNVPTRTILIITVQPDMILLLTGVTELRDEY